MPIKTFKTEFFKKASYYFRYIKNKTYSETSEESSAILCTDSSILLDDNIWIIGRIELSHDPESVFVYFIILATFINLNFAFLGEFISTHMIEVRGPDGRDVHFLYILLIWIAGRYTKDVHLKFYLLNIFIKLAKVFMLS